MSSDEGEETTSKEFLDGIQFSAKNIYRYERIYGHSWISPGGAITTKEICSRLNLKPGQKVLDIGCGVGGSAFCMARQYGCVVHGIDLSSDVISIAKHRLNQESETTRAKVTFETGDILEASFPNDEFDVIYSRDATVYVKEKEYLYSRVLSWLKHGGTLLVTEFLEGKQKDSPEFIDYTKHKGFSLRTITEYENTLKRAGFREVEAIDFLEMFLRSLEEELKYFIPTKEAFILDFSESDYDWVVKNWKYKLHLAKAGILSWGAFICKK